MLASFRTVDFKPQHRHIAVFGECVWRRHGGGSEGRLSGYDREQDMVLPLNSGVQMVTLLTSCGRYLAEWGPEAWRGVNRRHGAKTRGNKVALVRRCLRPGQDIGGCSWTD